MTKLFDIVLRHEEGESKFINCSVENAIGIIQQDLYMRGICIQLTDQMFWDIVFNRVKDELFELVNECKIVVRKSYRYC